MSLILKSYDPSIQAAWDRFVFEECPDATFFHLSGWKRVVEAAYGQSCPYVYAERDGKIVGVLPLVHLRSRLFGNRLVSTGFSIGGGVAALDDEAYAALDQEAERLTRALKVESLESRRPARLHVGQPGWVQKDGIYANFSRPLAASEEECLKQIPRKQRAVVRKALDANILTAKVETHADRFFPLYAFSMRNMGTPVFGKRFFRLLMEEFAGHCDCLTTEHEGVAISSVLSFYFRGAVMPYYTGCLLQARTLGANDFMYWSLMRHAAASGCVTFDFGRSKYGTGPFSFKKNWGFEPTPIIHEYFLNGGDTPSEINPLNPKYRLFIETWKRLPLPIANLLGPLVIGQIG